MNGIFRLFFVVSICGLAAVAGGDQPSANTARLIERLGSSVFDEREAARTQLEAIGTPALAELRKGAAHRDAEIARQSRRLVERIENGPDALVGDYRAYGLPFPPDDAPLVRFECGDLAVNDGLSEAPNRFLGFLLKPSTNDEPTRLLVGTHLVELPPDRRYESVDPKPELADDLPYWHGPGIFHSNELLAIGLQCQVRGWPELAERLVQQAVKRDAGHHLGQFRQPRDVAPRAALGHLAWAYSANELARPGTDRTATLRRMKALVAAERVPATDDNRTILRKLEATVAPIRSKPGTVERFIDELVELSDRDPTSNESPAEFERLTDVAFEAMPALIEHMGDERLTRTTFPGIMNSPPYHRPVGEVVAELIERLAGDGLPFDLERHRRPLEVRRSEIRAWWKQAQGSGQKTYFFQHVLPAGEEAVQTNDLLLGWIARRHPEQLPLLYRIILDQRPNVHSEDVAAKIYESSLPDVQKIAVLRYGSRHSDLVHRRFALIRLGKLDPAEFKKLFLATLESLPRTPEGWYWLSPESLLAEVVLTTNDEEIWRTFTQKVRASDVGLRMELLGCLDGPTAEKRQRDRRLDCLAQFLDDAEAPDGAADPEKYSGQGAATRFERTEVRYIAAMTAAPLLKLPDKPDGSWTPERWDEFVDRVKEEIGKR